MQHINQNSDAFKRLASILRVALYEQNIEQTITWRTEAVTDEMTGLSKDIQVVHDNVYERWIPQPDQGRIVPTPFTPLA